MLSRITAIASTAVRAAIRSRMVLSLVVLLVPSIIGLVATVKGDGTLAGQVSILLYYTLGMTGTTLGIATVWAACASISRDIETRQIRLVAVKPVYRLEIWLGKWVALLVINAMLLTLAGALIYGAVGWKIRRSAASDDQRRVLRDEILTGRRVVQPEPEDFSAQARTVLEQLRREGRAPKDVSDAEALDVLALQLENAHATVGTGASRQWLFTMPARRTSNSAIVLAFEFSGTAASHGPVSGSWAVGPEGGAERFTTQISNHMSGRHNLFVPPSAAPAGETIVVRFTNAGRDISHPASFKPKHGMELLIRETGFGTNFVRALVVMFCHLALLSALGLAAGALFSSPVAVFVTVAILVLSLGGHYFSTVPKVHHSHEDVDTVEPLSFADVAGPVIRKLHVIVAPAARLSPLRPVSTGRLVTPRFTARAIVLLAVAYPALFAFIAWLVLRRKELALPS